MEQCRAITFINFHIPRTEAPEEGEIQYTTLGFFDGMLTQKIQIGNNEDELKNLWKYTLKRTAKSIGQYSYQNIFCFGQDERNDCSDEQMWDEETDRSWPLTFVVFLQLQQYASESKSVGIVAQCRELSDKIKEKLVKEGKYYTYSTIDKNDYVVCIKCRDYRKAVAAIKNLHTIKANVVYSYSVFSVSNKVLDHFDEHKYLDIFNSFIDSICLKGVANSFLVSDNITLEKKYYEYSKRLVDKLFSGQKKGEYKVYDILGEDDFRLIARHVSLGRLLREYARGGLLNSSEEQVRFYLFSSSMVLNTVTPEQDALPTQMITNTCVSMKQKFDAPLCKKLEEKMREISARIKVQREIDDWTGQEETATICSAIWQLLQSLKALEIPLTKKYDFLSIYYPLEQLITILEGKMDSEQKLAELSSQEEVFDFIHKISMTLNGTLRTDIQFFQIRDFNAIVHYAPSKLRAFFSLWALYLSDYYSGFGNVGCKKSYSFILAPGMFSKVKIMQLFDDDAEEDRLMLIAVPERHLYMPKNLSIILGHEVSHYVGAYVRQRQVRHRVIIGIMARLLALEMNYYRWKVCREEWKDELGKVISSSNLHERLENLILEASEKVCREWKDMSDKYHSRNSARIIKMAHQGLAKTYLTKVIGEECERYNQALKEMKKDSPIQERVKKFQEIREITYGVEISLGFLYQKFQGQLDSFLGIFYHILKEACADINSILTLELTPEEYLLSFGHAEDFLDQQNAAKGKGSLRVVRHALVLKSINEKIAEGKDCFKTLKVWDCWINCVSENFEYIKIQSSDSRLKYTLNQINRYLYIIGKDLNLGIENYESGYDYQAECFQPKSLFFLKDKIVWEKMLLYGKACVSSYFSRLLNHENLLSSEKLMEKKGCLVETYRGIADGKIEKQLQTIENFLYCREKELLESKR